MTMYMDAFVPSRRIPTRDEWQHALDTLDMGAVKLSLYPQLDLEHIKGFCPILLSGLAAGVEISAGLPSSDDFEDLIAQVPALAGKITPEHTRISFRMGGRLSEAVCAQAACAGLISGFAAVVYDDVVGKIHTSPERLITGARVDLMVVEYGEEKPKTPEFQAELERVNGGPFPNLTIELQFSPLDLEYLKSRVVQPKD